MGEYIGFFLFLFFILMAFWLLVFLLGFIGFWATIGGLNSLMPGLFSNEKDQEETTS